MKGGKRVRLENGGWQDKQETIKRLRNVGAVFSGACENGGRGWVICQC